MYLMLLNLGCKMNSQPDISTFIFDLGGVVAPEAWDVISQDIADYMEISVEQLRRFAKENGNNLRTGRLTLEQYYSQALRLFETEGVAPKSVLQEHLRSYAEHGTARDSRVLEVIDELKGRYSVVCLTNTEHEIGEFNEQKGLFEVFEKAYLSCRIGFMKPSEEVWDYVFRDLGISPSQAVFIDDRQDCIDSSRQAGVENTFRYPGFEVGYDSFRIYVQPFLE
jgi:HAD superfamily hydrolase (TIGR01509 family)